jgi:hypothetical protein
MPVSVLAAGVSSAGVNNQMNNNFAPQQNFQTNNNFAPQSNFQTNSLDTTSYFQQQQQQQQAFGG